VSGIAHSQGSRLALFAFAVLLLGFSAAVHAKEDRPNIVFILADDLGYGDLACYGNPNIDTPRLDELARRGVRFTAHYANGPECSPTRAAFLTGRYQQWIGGLECAVGTGNVGRYDDAVRLRETNDLGLPASIPTLPTVLKKAGYATAIFGKWHLGYEPKFAPHHHGFDKSYYCIGGEMDYFHYIDLAAGYNLFRDGQPIRDDGYFTERMTDEAVEFLNRKRSEPYFLYLPYTAPHAPFQGPSDKQEHPLPLNSLLWKQGKAPPKVYRAMIESMDHAIGRVLDMIEKEDGDRSTLIVFASDNGGTGSARNDPYRGIKGGTFEGGIRVPAIAYWPGHLPKGRECKIPCLTFDFTKSFAAVAKAKFPESHRLDGVDILGLVANKEASPDRTLYWRKPRGKKIWRGVRRGDWKYIAQQVDSKEQQFLFNLAKDPSESENLLKQKQHLANELRRDFDAWEERTRRNRRGRPKANSNQD